MFCYDSSENICYIVYAFRCQKPNMDTSYAVLPMSVRLHSPLLLFSTLRKLFSLLYLLHFTINCILFSKMAANNIINIKWDHFGVYRRFQLPLDAVGDLYRLLLTKINVVVPDFEGKLGWKGNFRLLDCIRC